MRALAIGCIVASVGLHAAAWLLLGLDQTAAGGEAAPAVAPLSLVAEVAAAVDAADPAPAPAAGILEAPAPAVPTPAVPVPEQSAPTEARADEVTAWRAAGAGGAMVTQPVPEPRQQEEPRQEPDRAQTTPVPAAEPALRENGDRSAPEPPAGPAPPEAPQPTWRPGPPPGLRVPSSVLHGQPAADLVIDPRDGAFLARARALGMQFILFQDGALGFYLELLGDDLRAATRRTEVDGTRFSRRARDLAGVRAFDRLRDDVAERYGLDPARCRLAALVPLALDQAFRREELAALASLGRPAREVRALCGVLTGNGELPLRIGHALMADGRWLEVMP